MKKHLILCLLGLAQISAAQITSNRGTANMNDGLSLRQTDVKGSPFFIEDWSMGTIIDTDGSFKENKTLIYNVYNNNLFLKTGDREKDYIALQLENIAGFILYNKDKTKSFVFSKIKGVQFQDLKDTDKFYLQVSPKDNKVIIEPLKIFKDPNSSGWVSSRYNNKAGEFNDITKVYVLARDNKYHKISLKEKSLLTLFKDKKEAISNYIKKNNIKIKEAVDLVPIVAYYYQ